MSSGQGAPPGPLGPLGTPADDRTQVGLSWARLTHTLSSYAPKKLNKANQHARQIRALFTTKR